MDSRAIIRLIEAEGWELKAVRGSHHNFKHAMRPGKVTVQHLRKDVPLPTVISIENQLSVRLRRPS